MKVWELKEALEHVYDSDEEVYIGEIGKELSSVLLITEAETMEDSYPCPCRYVVLVGKNELRE